MSATFDSKADPMWSVAFFRPESELRASAPVFTPKRQMCLDDLPDYDITMSKVNLMAFLKQMNEDDLRGFVTEREEDFVKYFEDRNYPPFWIKSIVQSCKHSAPLHRMTAIKVVQDRGRVNVAESKKSSSSKAVRPDFEAKKGSGRAAKIFRIEFTGTYTPVPRPTYRTYSKAVFRRWVKGVVTAMRQFKTRKTQVISGNVACETLWFASKFTGRREDLQHMLDSCSIYIDDYNYLEASFTPSLPSLSSFIPIRSVSIFGESVHSLMRLCELVSLFRADKPLFRSIGDYLCGKDMDASRLQRLLDKKYAPPPVVVEPARPLPDIAPPDIVRPSVAPYLDKVGQPVEQEERVAPSQRRADQQRVPGPDFGPQFPPLGWRWPPCEVIHYQGAGASRPAIDIQHHAPASAEVAELVDTLKLSLREAFADLPPSLARTLIQFLALIVSLYQAENWKAATAAVVQFASGNDWVWSQVSRLLNFTTYEVQYQGVGAAEKFSEYVVSLWDSVVASGVVMVVGAAFADVRDYLSGPILEFLSAVRGSLLRDIAKDFAGTVISGLGEMLARVRSAIAQRSFGPLWGIAYDPVAWTKEVETMMTYYPLLTTSSAADPLAAEKLHSLRVRGLISKEWTEPVTIPIFLERCEVYREQGRGLAKYFSKVVAVSRDISAVLARFHTFEDAIRAGGDMSALRVAPFMIYYYGEPGGGKTIFSQQVAKAVAQKNGYDATPIGTYSWQRNVNFQTGLDHTKWNVIMDDVDHSVAPETAGIQNHIESILMLVNNAPLPVEQSDNSLKGKIRANPLMLQYLSNFVDAHVWAHERCPEAFWRRISIHATIRAAPGFRRAGSEQLDKDIAMASCTHDMLEVEVRYFDPSMWDGSDLRAIPLTPPETFTVTEFVKLVHLRFEAHLKRERELLRTRSILGKFCPICFLDTTKACGCCQVALQGKCTDFVEGIKLSTAHFLNFAGIRPLRWEEIRASMCKGIESLNARAFTAGLVAAAGAVGVGVVALRTSFEYMQGRTLNTSGFAPMNWFRAEQKFTPGLPPTSYSATFSKDELLACVAKAQVKVEGNKYQVTGYMVAHNTMVTPTHAIPPLGQSIRVTYQSKSFEIQMTPFNVRRLASNPELSQVVCGNLPCHSLHGKIWPAVDEMLHSFDEVEIWSGDVLKYKPSFNQVVMRQGVKILVTDAPTIEGDCGDVYLARFNSSWWVVGMHYAIVYSHTMFGVSQNTSAGLLSAAELARVAATMGTTYQGVVLPASTVSRVGAPAVVPFPLKSEVWAAMSAGIATPYCVGTVVPPMAGSTMKTKLSRSLISEEFAEFELEWCGQTPYWNLPDFRGKMVDGHWTSPWTDSFLTENRGDFLDEIMWLALADYLSPAGQLDVTGFATLSEEQAINGVPGAGVHGMNMRTSSGPPLNQSKKMHFAPSVGEAAFSPAIDQILTEIQGILDAGQIPAALGLCTLKDEALKPGKIPRVFTNFPSAFNLEEKCHLTPVQLFMRAYVSVFECAVGINMTSSECSRVVFLLQQANEALDRLKDGDGKRLDKSWSGRLYDFVGLVFYALSYLLGLDACRMHSIFLGTKYCHMVIKNDMFLTSWNPSGHQGTVEWNSVLISLCDRYVYYYDKYRSGLPEGLRLRLVAYMEGFFKNPVVQMSELSYRHDCVLVTYGDDFLGSMREGVEIPPDCEEIWKEHLGITMTDASKTGRMRLKRLAEVTFLKRSFVYDDELQQYLPPIDVKSIARMLVIKKDTYLSAVDHACVAMTEALREAAYHGEAFYNKLKAKVQQVATRRALESNPYLVIQDFSQVRERMASGAFQTWVVRDPLPYFDVTSIDS